MKRTLLLGLAVIGLILVFSSCSTSEETDYDITGNWTFTLTRSSGSMELSQFAFTGTPESGSAVDVTRGRFGSYLVTGQAVSITLITYIDSTCGNLTEYITGSFTSTDAMSGTFNSIFQGPCMLMDTYVSWTAVRY